MNKIEITDNEINLRNNAVILDIKVNKLLINIEGNVLINEIDKKDEKKEITVNVLPGSSLIYNRFMIHNKTNSKFFFKQDKLSTLEFNYAFISHECCNLVIDNSINDDSNNTFVNIRVIKDSNSTCNISNNITGDIKIINNDELDDCKKKEFLNSIINSSEDILEEIRNREEEEYE